MQKIKSKLFVFAVTALLFLANVTAASACAISQYQPEVPETLRR
ncbi:cyclic lactone autoinducer peptide [Desulfoscipio sp. XC116]